MDNGLIGVRVARLVTEEHKRELVPIQHHLVVGLVVREVPLKLATPWLAAHVHQSTEDGLLGAIV
jgi:hypothetical protein